MNYSYLVLLYFCAVTMMNCTEPHHSTTTVNTAIPTVSTPTLTAKDVFALLPLEQIQSQKKHPILAKLSTPEARAAISKSQSWQEYHVVSDTTMPNIIEFQHEENNGDISLVNIGVYPIKEGIYVIAISEGIDATDQTQKTALFSAWQFDTHQDKWTNYDAINAQAKDFWIDSTAILSGELTACLEENIYWLPRHKGIVAYIDPNHAKENCNKYAKKNDKFHFLEKIQYKLLFKQKNSNFIVEQLPVMQQVQ